MASFFVFLASASFIYIEHFGLTPTGFSLAFSVNAIGFFGASQMRRRSASASAWRGWCSLAVPASRRSRRCFSRRARRACDSLPVLIVHALPRLRLPRLVIPTTAVLALDQHPDIAGMASALGGTLQMVAGGA